MEKGYIQVFWVKAHPRYAYHAGEEGIIKSENAPQLIKEGYVIPLSEKEEEKKNPLPEDLPGRDKLFANGFDSVEKIIQAGDSLLDVGISNATLKKIHSYLNSK